MLTKLTPKQRVIELGKVDCEKCSHCCKYGSAYVLPEDFKKMCKVLGVSEQKLRHKYLDEHELFHTKMHKIRLKKNGKPYGRCVFQNDAEGCTIHSAKPLFCQIGTCKEHADHALDWFYLNYAVKPDDNESIRQWASRLKFKSTIPGGALEELVPDKARLIKILSYQL